MAGCTKVSIGVLLRTKYRHYSRRPDLILILIQELLWKLAETFLPYWQVSCPVCGWKGRRFRAFAYSDGIRKNVLCGGCHTGSRQRSLVLQQQAGRLTHSGMMGIDFGSRKAYGELFADYGVLIHFIDLSAKDVDARMDITRLAIKESQLDFIGGGPQNLDNVLSYESAHSERS